MDNNGFDDIELNNRNIEEDREDEEREEGETSGGNFADTNFDTGETTRLLSPTDPTGQNETPVRVENLDNTKSRRFYDKFKKMFEWN